MIWGLEDGLGGRKEKMVKGERMILMISYPIVPRVGSWNPSDGSRDIAWYYGMDQPPGKREWLVKLFVTSHVDWDWGGKPLLERTIVKIKNLCTSYSASYTCINLFSPWNNSAWWILLFFPLFQYRNLGQINEILVVYNAKKWQS